VNIKEWGGISAGSLLALMLGVGYTLKELRTFCEQFDFTHLIDLDDATGWILRMGIDTGDSLKRLIEALLKEKGFGPNLTFQELATARPKNPLISIYVTDVNKGHFVVYSQKTSPNFKVVDAVRASSAIPIYFQPIIDPTNGHVLVDGGCVSNLPFLSMTEEERQETIGLNLCKKLEPMDELDMVDILYRPMVIGMKEQSLLENAFFKQNIIAIETRITNPLAFNLTQDEKAELLAEGRQAVRKFLAEQRPPRRWSVS